MLDIENPLNRGTIDEVLFALFNIIQGMYKNRETRLAVINYWNLERNHIRDSVGYYS